MCRTGLGAGSSAGADKGPDCRKSNLEWTDDQAGRRRLANTDPDGGSLVHAADDTPSKNAATRDKPWQPQQGYDQKETPQATPPTHAQTQNMP